MHLQVTSPSFWYEIHLNDRETGLNIYGRKIYYRKIVILFFLASIPGIGLVIGGHNDKIALGSENYYYFKKF